jgi:hypothetical protein
MSAQAIKKIVRVVLDARKKNLPDGAIAEQLKNLRVRDGDIPIVIESVDLGFKAGVNSVITCGLSDTQLEFGTNPIFDYAFSRGKAAMRFTTGGWLLVKVVGPWLLLALALIAILYFVFF